MYDGEGQPEHLGRGGLELGEHRAAEVDVEALDRRLGLADVLRDRDRLFLVDLARQLDHGVGDLAGPGALERDLALAGLVDLLTAGDGGDGRVLDVQWQTPHLASLGAVEVDRADYLARVAVAVERPPPPVFA